LGWTRSKIKGLPIVRRSGFFNAITLLIFVAVLGVLTVALAALLSPAPPPQITPMPTFIGDLPTETPTNTPTATATPTASLPPTFTPRPTVTKTLTSTPTSTGLPSATPILPSATPSQTLTFTPTATFTETPIPFPYVIRGEADFSANTVNTLSCAWQGIGGRVMGEAGELSAEQAAGLFVRVISDAVETRARIGSNSQYGATTGWEITLDSRPEAMLVYVRLESEAGAAQSPDALVRFNGDCTANLARLDFAKNQRFVP